MDAVHPYMHKHAGKILPEVPLTIPIMHREESSPYGLNPHSIRAVCAEAAQRVLVALSIYKTTVTKRHCQLSTLNHDQCAAEVHNDTKELVIQRHTSSRQASCNQIPSLAPRRGRGVESRG